jgi:serine protease Do
MATIWSTVEIGYLRDGVKHSASVTIGDRAKVYADIAGNDTDTEPPPPVDAGQTKLGITVTAIPATTASKLGIQGGVAVASVTPGSFADEIGLGKGALIVEINRQPVTDEASYRAIVARIKMGDDVVFVVRAPGGKGGNSFVGGTLR